MNFLKKKLKPFASGLIPNNLSSNNNNNNNNKQTNLEDDLYDEYVVEAPPHPSELIALGVDPSKIDVNDPDKLRELYKKAKEDGKQTNSVFLAKQRQKEEIEEKKRTKEEWKFFDSLTLRVEQAVKDSQKTLEQFKESSAVDKLSEPEYPELRLQSVGGEARLQPNKVLNNNQQQQQQQQQLSKLDKSKEEENKFDDDDELDEFGCPKSIFSTNVATGSAKSHAISAAPAKAEVQNFIAEELLEDIGIDLRSEKQKRELEMRRKQQLEEENRKREQQRRQQQREAEEERERRKIKESQEGSRGQVGKQVDLKLAARPRPRPGASGSGSAAPAAEREQPNKTAELNEAELDPFDTSFLADDIDCSLGKLSESKQSSEGEKKKEEAKDVGEKKEEEVFVDPFDTSYINF